MGAAFGAGGANSLFGASGANNLVVKITTFVAIAFMVTSITLINLSNSDSAVASATAVSPEDALAGSVMGETNDPNAVAAIVEATPTAAASTVEATVIPQNPEPATQATEQKPAEQAK